MIFGEGFVAPAAADAADWLDGACDGRFGTVGGLVPNNFDAYIRVVAPDPEVPDWWADYRSLFETIAGVARGHTSTPDEGWFAVWEGHGWESATSRCALVGPAGPVARLRARAVRARLRRNDRRRRATIRDGLSVVPAFDRPHRTYYLVAGTVESAGSLREPGSPERWQRPDLWWPADRRWFVATDVDFWSLYVGGSVELIADIAAAVPTAVESVSLDADLPTED